TAAAAASATQRASGRWPPGTGSRRRPGRGGKRPPLSATPACPLPLPPPLPHQEAVRQHPRDRVPVEPLPQPTLVLVPAQQPLGLLVVLLHPVPPVAVLDQPLQGYPGAEVAPVILALAGRRERLLADQPAQPAPPVGQHPPT